MSKTTDPAAPDVRKGQAPDTLDRESFRQRYKRRYADPNFGPEADAIDRLEAIAWKNYQAGRKAPVTQPAGAGFADPSYEISVEWLDTRRRLRGAQQRWEDPATPSRLLIVCASARNDGTCPGEVSKTWRLAEIARATAAAAGIETRLLDLSELSSEFGRAIHPCKGCVATAMPLCHWPCSCYPNHSLGQVNDWMAEIYEEWVSAHGVIIVAPTYWYQSPAGLKAMIDRLVCADGGNPDPSSTHGKKPEEAKAIERDGWAYPKHLAGRAFGVMVHGDVAGIEVQRRNLVDWLSWMGLIEAGTSGALDRYIGYYEPYWNSHQALDADVAVQEEMRNIARAVTAAIGQLRAGELKQPDAQLKRPRPK